MHYQDHPIAAIFPLMPAAELQEMADDIKAHGLRTDIALYEGKILDGRNRYRACMLAGLQPTTYAYAGDDPVGEVLSLNLHRRHLTASQKAAIAAEALPHFEAESKKRQGARTDITANLPESSQGESREQAAKQVGVSPRYVSDAKRIKEASPETFEKLKNGEVSMSEAKAEIAPKPEPAAETPNIKYTPALGLQTADNAIRILDTITKDDSQRREALEKVAAYCARHLK